MFTGHTPRCLPHPANLCVARQRKLQHDCPRKRLPFSHPPPLSLKRLRARQSNHSSLSSVKMSPSSSPGRARARLVCSSQVTVILSSEHSNGLSPQKISVGPCVAFTMHAQTHTLCQVWTTHTSRCSSSTAQPRSTAWRPRPCPDHSRTTIRRPCHGRKRLAAV